MSQNPRLTKEERVDQWRQEHELELQQRATARRAEREAEREANRADWRAVREAELERQRQAAEARREAKATAWADRPQARFTAHEIASAASGRIKLPDGTVIDTPEKFVVIRDANPRPNNAAELEALLVAHRAKEDE